MDQILHLHSETESAITRILEKLNQNYDDQEERMENDFILEVKNIVASPNPDFTSTAADANPDLLTDNQTFLLENCKTYFS